MNGHPALVYLVALQQLRERRQLMSNSEALRESRQMRRNGLRHILGKEARDVARTV